MSLAAVSLRFRSDGVREALAGLRPTWAMVDLDALAGNFRAVRATVGPDVQVLAVVKADAYGHGAVPVARTLREAGASFFGVALIEEGIEIRRAGIEEPILALGAIAPAQARAAVRHRIVPALFARDTVEAFAAAAREEGLEEYPWHLKVDTGMGRLGVPCAEVPAFLESTRDLRGPLRLEGVFTALATADEPRHAFTALQVRRFMDTLPEVERREGPVRWKHLANSAAVFGHPPAWVNLVRPGIALYGMQPGAMPLPQGIRPVLRLRTEVAFVKEVPPDTPLGYGGIFVTRRESRIATLPIGYDDGLVRMLSEAGAVLVRGHRAPIAGRISMDLTMADVTDVPGVEAGDEAVVIGAQGEERIATEEVAQRVRSIPYEITCGIGRRVPRVYLRGGEVVEVRSRFGNGTE